MSGISSSDIVVFAALAGFVVVLVLIGIISTQLFASASRTKNHLANAARFQTASNALQAKSSSFSARNENATERSDDAESALIVNTLNEYFAANINQGIAIFWASLLAMIAGFIIIIVGLTIGMHDATTAIVAAVAGLLSQFIGATFLVALRSTQAQSTTYAQSLAELRGRDLRASADAKAIALGLQLLNEIGGDGAAVLANQTRAALAMGLIVKEPLPANPTVTVTPVPVDTDLTARSTSKIVPRMRAETVVLDETRAQGDSRTGETRSS